MRRHLLPVGSVALVSAGFCGLSVWLTYPRPGITAKNCRRLYVGMARAEAEAVLGGPGKQLLPGMYGTIGYSWRSEECYVGLRFNDYTPGGTERACDGYIRMADGASEQLGQREEAFLCRLRRLLPW
jgi:hypothetical protein